MSNHKVKYCPRGGIEELEDIVKCAKNQYIIENISYRIRIEDNLIGWFIYVIYAPNKKDRVSQLYIHSDRLTRYETIDYKAFYKLLILNEY